MSLVYIALLNIGYLSFCRCNSKQFLHSCEQFSISYMYICGLFVLTLPSGYKNLIRILMFTLYSHVILNQTINDV